MAKHAPRLQEYLSDAQGRIRGDLKKTPQDAALSSARLDQDRLLLLAHKRVDRKIWFRRTLPLHLLFAIPAILIGATRSSRVLFLLIATSPLILVVRAVLSRALSAWIGPRDLLIRRELDRLSQSSHEGS